MPDTSLLLSTLHCKLANKQEQFEEDTGRLPGELILKDDVKRLLYNEEFRRNVRFIPTLMDSNWEAQAKLAGFTAWDFVNCKFFVMLSGWKDGRPHRWQPPVL